MFAVVANGIQTICKTQRQLDVILALYPYPKFKKFSNEREAMEWLRVNTRTLNISAFNKYGETASRGYVSIEYFISDNNIYYNLRTDKLGYIKIWSNDKDVKIESRYNLIKIKVCNVCLRDELIAHHAIAIRRILKILGEYVDVDIKVPDMSIMLAAKNYSGNNYLIKGLQRDLKSRLGGVSFTVKE